MEPTEFLEKIYNESMAVVGSDNEIKSDLDSTIANHLLEILGRSESAKAVITVILTSSVYKKLNPDQDIRKVFKCWFRFLFNFCKVKFGFLVSNYNYAFSVLWQTKI